MLRHPLLKLEGKPALRGFPVPDRQGPFAAAPSMFISDVLSLNRLHLRTLPE